MLRTIMKNDTMRGMGAFGRRWLSTFDRVQPIAIVMLALAGSSYRARADPGDVARGEAVFRACAACHSLEPGRNMTGPSLSGLWNREAGSMPGFRRYSPALKSAEILWDDKTLDGWIDDPAHFIPRNTMIFAGIKDAQQRSDLLAFLKDATQPGRAPMSAGQGGMMGMMGGTAVPNLKVLDAKDRVQSITHCGDSYKVTTGDGKTRDIWERNLRFKTDTSDDGPEKGAPALVPAGMMGDRADVIFAAPEEISALISNRC